MEESRGVYMCMNMTIIRTNLLVPILLFIVFTEVIIVYLIT